MNWFYFYVDDSNVYVGRRKAFTFMNHLDRYAMYICDVFGKFDRNLQMMLSCLFRNAEYAERLKPINMNASGEKLIQVPSITRLQNAIEEAWKQGFDVEVNQP